MRLILVSVVPIWLVLSGCEGTAEYANPYQNPRAQWEYDQWVSHQTEQKFRAEASLRNENFWLQTPERENPACQQYMRNLDQTNARLQQLRGRGKSAKFQNFHEWMKLSKATLAKTRSREAFSPKKHPPSIPEGIRDDPIRIKRFLNSQKQNAK